MSSKLRVIFHDFFRSAHQLWLEVMGALFLVLGVAFALSAFREYRKLDTLSETPGWLVIAAAALSVLTLAFGIHSFWKARKLR